MFDGHGFVSPFDGMGLDDAEEWLRLSKPAEEHARQERLRLLDAHIERLWMALSEQSKRRLGVIAVSTGTSVGDYEHAELLGAMALIAEAEGTLQEEQEFCETYLSVPWVCAAVAEYERTIASPAKEKLSRRREQTRLAVARHRERQKEAETAQERKKRQSSEERMGAIFGMRAIALDGEGMNTDDGGHIYRYMAASRTDGVVLGELTNEKGISTAEALEFVTALPKADEDGVPYLGVFGYGLGYDITKWLERLSNKPLFELFHSDDLKPKAKCGAINLLLIGKCLELVDRKAPKGHRQTKVWDIIKGFQSTFVKALIAWNVGTKAEWDHLEAMKKQRGNFAHSDWVEVQSYCKAECRLLAQLVETYIRAHVEAGIDLRGKYHGAGSTSDAFLMTMKALDKRCTRDVRSDDLDAFGQTKSAFSRAFFGGRAEVNRLGIVRGPVWTADIASAYPHVLFSLPCVRHGKWQQAKGRGLKRSLRAAKVAVVHFRMPLDPAHAEDLQTLARDDLGELGERIVRGPRLKARKARKKRKEQVAIETGQESEDEVTELQRGVGERALMAGIEGSDVGNRAWGPLPYRTAKSSIVFPVCHPGGWAWLPEYEVAARHYPQLEATEAWVLKGSCQCERPYQAIGEFYLLRIEWGSDGKGKVLKLGYNGCYGKFAQVIGKNPKYSCRVVAGHITASTRGRLFEAAMSASDPWNVFYAATDGLISTEKLDPPNPVENETTPKTKKWLGVWEIEAVEWKDELGGKHADDLFVVQPGFWFSLAAKGKARTRGTPLELIYEFRPKILEQWCKDPTRKPRGLPKQSTFHGVKSSIRPPSKESRGKYKRDPLYGRWTSEHRKINYVVSPKRSALVDQGDESYRLMTWRMNMSLPESAEYKKDPSFAEKDTINDEQPDYVEPLGHAVGGGEE